MVAVADVLRLLQRVVDRHLAGKCRREQLADSRAEALEFGDGDELHADIRHRLDGRLGRIGGVDASPASSWRRARPSGTRDWCRARCACPGERWPSLPSRRRGRDRPCWSPRRRTSAPRPPSACRPEWPATMPTASCRACRGRCRAPAHSRPCRRRWSPSGSDTKEAATVASIHMPHLPCWNSARFSLKPLDEAPCGPASFIRLT